MANKRFLEQMMKKTTTKVAKDTTIEDDITEDENEEFLGIELNSSVNVNSNNINKSSNESEIEELSVKKEEYSSDSLDNDGDDGEDVDNSNSSTNNHHESIFDSRVNLEVEEINVPSNNMDIDNNRVSKNETSDSKVQDEKAEDSIEQPAKPRRRKPGPKPKLPEIPSPEEPSAKSHKETNRSETKIGNANSKKDEKFDIDKNNKINNSSFSSINGADDNCEISKEILNFVCNKTIENLLDNYESEIYTKTFVNKLFKQYIDGEIDSSNPLFKELITECIKNNVVDDYLGDDLTIKVLTYIQRS